MTESSTRPTTPAGRTPITSPRRSSRNGGRRRRCLLLSTYEQGHQPLAVASLAAALRSAGHLVSCHDLALEAFEPDWLSGAEVVCISVPMHTAARLGLEAAQRVRAYKPTAAIVFFGTYAGALREVAEAGGIADLLVVGEYEAVVTAWLDAGCRAPDHRSGSGLPLASSFRQGTYPVPDRSDLPPLDRYARVRAEEGLLPAGYTEASRGCAHQCAHCPLTPVWGGRLRLVPRAVVLADIDQQVAAGARHITFGDPDFLNAVPHSLAICEELHARHPEITFDITAKVEHLVQERALLPRLRALGCLFVTSAFESTSDALLARLGKGHTRAEMEAVVEATRSAGLTLLPTWMAFTPWTRADDYLGLLEFVERHDLVGSVQPVQYGLRLLLPPGSPLIPQARAEGVLGAFEADLLTYSWHNPDARLDELQGAIESLIGDLAGASCGEERSREAVFQETREAAFQILDAGPPPPLRSGTGRFVPGLTEDWFC